MARFIGFILTLAAAIAFDVSAFAEEQRVVLRDGEAMVLLKWNGDINDQFYLEISRTGVFQSGSVKSFTVTGNEYLLNVKEVGDYFWRVQVRDRDEQPSKVEKFIVEGLRSLAPPKNIRFAKGYEYQDQILVWDPVPSSTRYVYQIYDYQKKSVVRTDVVTDSYKGESIWGSFLPDWDKAKKKPRYYYARVATISDDGQVGAFSNCLRTKVGSSKLKRRPPRTAKIDFCNDRVPAAVASSKITAPIVDDYFGYNKAYKNSLVQVEGASFLMGNVIESQSVADFAAAMMTTVRGMWWMNRRFGVEGIFKSKVAGYNESGNGVAPMGAEARAHIRWNLKPFIFKSVIRDLQLSLIGGYEVYKNETPLNFTSGYSLPKGGIGLKIPLWENWETGGEAMLGYGFDSAQKIEFQGYMNYYYKKHWSVGGGYKVHLFGAGTPDQSPDGVLPYREAYIELLGNLRYSF